MPALRPKARREPLGRRGTRVGLHSIPQCSIGVDNKEVSQYCDGPEYRRRDWKVKSRVPEYSGRIAVQQIPFSYGVFRILKKIESRK